MSTGFAWLQELMSWLGRWVPRLVLIEPTHRGVLFGPRGGARETGPGIVCYWPISHALVLVPVTTQSIGLNGQILPLVNQDGTIVPRVTLCAAAVQFQVADPVRAATRCLHLHALVDNRAQAAIARHVDYDDPRAWRAKTEDDLARDLAPFGVQLERLDFVQCGIGVALKQVADWNYSDQVAGTRPT